MNEREETIEAVLRGVDRSLDRGLGITRLALDYAQLGRVRVGIDVVQIRTVIDPVMVELEDDFAAQRIAIAVDVPA